MCREKKARYFFVQEAEKRDVCVWEREQINRKMCLLIFMYIQIIYLLINLFYNAN